MDFAAEFLAENQAFGDLVLSAPQDTPVPSCPGWTLKQLFHHIGRGHRWVAQIIVEGTDVDPATVAHGKPPEDLDAARQWLLDGGRLLVDTAADAADTQAWTFVGPQPVSWWLRRRLHETLVHRADAAIAVDTEFVVAPALAADALSEWLDIVFGLGRGAGDRSLHLHATDDGLGAAGEWTIAHGAWTHAHGKGDVALRGPATDLLLAVTGRRDIADTAVELFGDDAVWRTWLDNAKF